MSEIQQNPPSVSPASKDYDQKSRWLWAIPLLVFVFAGLAYVITESAKAGEKKSDKGHASSSHSSDFQAVAIAPKKKGLASPAALDLAAGRPGETSARRSEEPTKSPAQETNADLPGGANITFNANGIEGQLIAFIRDENKPVDRTTWFTFDSLEFESGRATIRPSSQKQLENIATILRAFPDVKLKIGGYTDNTGNAETNQKLSTDRANATRDALITLGIDGTRLEAEGYGPQFPKADNATEEGRQKNRRIDVRVTAK
ncbi:MAG: OmpA family protein [Fimbriimonadaceae bacterium]|jgi:outer membrane protein OmpA-like peptidoglycan-associated protein|nr:OmpA family protein [Fimbriimonadaceae bacterium]